MPTTKAHKTRHHSNLRPKHRHTTKYLQAYAPYLPLLGILFVIITLLAPWRMNATGKVLPYATNVSKDSLLQLTNQQRTNNNREPLRISKDLNEAAQAKAQDMVKKNYWSHTSPNGKSPWVFVADSGYTYQKAGENLAYGFVTSEQVVAGWMNSRSHRANVLDQHYKDVGFGFADSENFDGNGPATIVVAMYATPIAAMADSKQLSPENLAADTGTTPVPSQVTTPTDSQSINRVQAITKGLLPWGQYIVGIITGAALMFLLVKHGISLKRLIHKGEKFMIHHPVLDATLISLVILGVILSQRVGTIL